MLWWAHNLPHVCTYEQVNFTWRLCLWGACGETLSEKLSYMRTSCICSHEKRHYSACVVWFRGLFTWFHVTVSIYWNSLGCPVVPQPVWLCRNVGIIDTRLIHSAIHTRNCLIEVACWCSDVSLHYNHLHHSFSSIRPQFNCWLAHISLNSVSSLFLSHPLCCRVS